MTHDYKRNGTAVLFAALNTLDGSVISMCDDQHRHQEWLTFLRVIDDVTPPGKELYLIADNYSTHKHPKVRRWLALASAFPHGLHADQQLVAQHGGALLPRPHPTADPPRCVHDVEELIMAIGEYIDRYNEQPKPFVWTATAADILAKVTRAREALHKR